MIRTSTATCPSIRRSTGTPSGSPSSGRCSTSWTPRSATCKLVLVPHLAGEPIGPKALGELLDSARRRDGSPPPGPLRPVVDRESGAGLDAVYRMRLELPQVDSGALTLGRVDDDLIIGAGGMRRRVRLASVLRRCIVMDAQLRGSELTVRFRPNPEVWPA